MTKILACSSLCSNIAVPSNYSSAAYNWTNWSVWDATDYAAIVPTSGFSTGVVSPKNVAWNNFAQVGILLL